MKFKFGAKLKVCKIKWRKMAGNGFGTLGDHKNTLPDDQMHV